MTIEFSIKSDLGRLAAQIERLRDRDLPFIAETAINTTMPLVKERLRMEMDLVFDRPTPFTLNSLQIFPVATKEQLWSELSFKDQFGKGNAAKEYLAPQIYGGSREHKKFEQQLANAGILPKGMFVVPARNGGGPLSQGLELDRYGNIPGSYLNSVLSYLRARRDGTQNRSTLGNKRRGPSRKQQWFAINDPKNKLPMGIYERKDGAFHLVLLFVEDVDYTVRFNFASVATAAAAREAPAQIEDAIRRALYALDKYGAQWEAEDKAAGLL